MEKFQTLDAIAAPLDLANVDTDRIIPARFLRRPRSEGYGQFLFHDLREGGGFVLDRPEYRGAQILVAGENFGCGSSREGAVWALAGAGFRAWIAPSFGDIFFDNSFKNGVLAVVLPKEKVLHLQESLRTRPGLKIHIDLPRQTVTLEGAAAERFEVDAFRKACLVEGVDDIDLTLRHEEAIAAYERRREAQA